MSIYTSEQVDSAAEILEQNQNAPSWKRLSAMLRDYATLLRERESAKARVTHTMIREAKDAFENSSARDATGWWRSALEAVAPMLASARVPDGWQMVPVELCQRVSAALGRFVGDEGWGVADMDTADEFGATMLAAAPKPEKE